MKLSVSQLRSIIKEEVSRMLRENEGENEDKNSKAVKNLPVPDLRDKAKLIQKKLSGDSLKKFNQLLMKLFNEKEYKWNWDVIYEIDEMNEKLELQEIDVFTDALREREDMHREQEEYSRHQEEREETGLDESRLRRKLRRR